MTAALTVATVLPAGWRVIAFSGSFKKGGEQWEVYAPDGSGGAVERSEVSWPVSDLLDALATASTPPTGLESGCVGIALHTLRETRAFVTGNAASRIDAAIAQIERLTGEGGAG